jgi:hypothetical protein
VSSLPKEQRDIIEADSFWCLSKFLDGIQDNYIFAQLGIQHKVNQLKELIQRIDGKNSMELNSNLSCKHDWCHKVHESEDFSESQVTELTLFQYMVT